MAGPYRWRMENPTLSTPPATAGIEQMLRRVQGEFLEMPGLRLTCQQAQRLWNLDALVCESILAALVDVRFLIELDGVFLQPSNRA